MSLPTFGHALLVFFAALDSGLCQRSLHGVPFAGIGSVRPLRSASPSSFSSPLSTVLNGSISEIEGETTTNSTSLNSTADAVDSVATNSSWSSETDVSGSVWANSSSSSSSSSVVYALELISTNTSTAVGDTVLSNSSGVFTNVSAVEKELAETLEVDEQVTVLGEVQLGELLCDSLVQAEDAPLLQFALSANETIIANRTSYTVVSGETFTGGVGRRIWNGVVIDPEPDAGEAFPRGVSMTWGEVCDVETFSLKVSKHTVEGNTSAVKSVPCGLSGVEVCLVEVAFDFLPGKEPLRVGVNSTGQSTAVRRRLGDGILGGGSRDRHQQQQAFGWGWFGGGGGSGRRRKLQSDTVEIQVMVLYTNMSLVLMGVSDVQMETMVSAAISTVNVGFENSNIGIETTTVYKGRLPYYQDCADDSSTKLSALREDEGVNALRDEYGADIVLLVDYLTDACGIA
ncbi:conserved unknown protein [Ectocarpus siliculosus]|uniref:Uncharacterized protein n=1 Tax=Ectocarpus siliculosus TaxID=2880 RepID=D8LCP8_ECTSI|nr:conserved unknown protein [Ectocarpus siliculosus]|eukprot:CBN79561.1 conserved unknown protein [Ectocarpus siliculosus]